MRLDRYLAARLPELSRTRIQELIAEGRAQVNGKPAKAAHHIAAGERVEFEVVPRPSLDAQPEAIPLEILYEDAQVVVVNKPAGLTVHTGAGHARGTLVNALVHRFRQLSGVSGPLRPGIVHRLDKQTSGVLVVARTDAAHRNLADQFRNRTVGKTYLALVHGRVVKDTGSINAPVARDLKRRTRMTTRRAGGREAQTDWRVLARLDGFTLLAAQIHTGRTHQIRVHFSSQANPVVGDTLYGAPREPRAGRTTLAPLGRNFLHAARISFLHPESGKPVEVRAPLPAELCEYLRQLARALGLAAGFVDEAAKGYL